MKLSKETISLLEKEGWTIREESDGYVTIGNCLDLQSVFD